MNATLTRRVRRLRAVIVALLLTVILLGSLSAYLLRSLDRDYSALIDRSVPVLNELRVLTAETLSTQRALLASLAAVDEEGRVRSLVYMEAQMELGRLGRESIAGREVFAGDAQRGRKLNAAGASYETLAAQFVALMKAGRVDDAQRLRNEKIKDVIAAYLAEIEAAAQFVAGESHRARDSFSGAAHNQSLLLLSLAGLPIALVLVLGIVIAAFAAFALMVFFWSEPENGTSA
jgi:hypothetical protein